MKPTCLTDVTYIFTYRSSGAVPSQDCFQRCAPTFSTYKNFVAAMTSGGGVGSGSGVGIRLPMPEKLRGGAGLTEGPAVGIRLWRRWFRLACFLPGTATG